MILAILAGNHGLVRFRFFLPRYLPTGVNRPSGFSQFCAHFRYSVANFGLTAPFYFSLRFIMSVFHSPSFNMTKHFMQLDLY